MKAPKFYRIFEYNPALLPNAHLASLEDGVRTIDEARGRTGATIGYPAWGLLYYTLLCQLNPDTFNVVLETGTNFGSSAIILGQALKDSGRPGKCHTIEIEEENYSRAKDNICKAGLEAYCECHLGDALQILPQILAQYEAVQIAFLDGSHVYEQVLAEFGLLWPKMTHETVVVFDNTYQIAEEGEDPRVNGALKEIQRQYGGNLINLQFASWYTPGFALWQKQAFEDMTPPSVKKVPGGV